MVVGILTELCQGLDHGGLVLPDRLHGGHVLRRKVEPVTLEGEGGVKTDGGQILFILSVMATRM